MIEYVVYLPRLILLIGLSLLLVALAFFFQIPAATDLWLWPDGPALGFVFVAAMLAGAAIPLVWIGFSEQLSALPATMLTGIVANSGIAFHLYSKHSQPGKEFYLSYVALFGLGAILTLLAFFFSQRLPASKDKPIPPIIRWVFLFFAVVLLLVGGGVGV